MSKRTQIGLIATAMVALAAGDAWAQRGGGMRGGNRRSMQGVPANDGSTYGQSAYGRSAYGGYACENQTGTMQQQRMQNRRRYGATGNCTGSGNSQPS